MWHIQLSHKSDSIDLIVVLFMPPDSNISSSFWSKKINCFFPLVICPQFYKTYYFWCVVIFDIVILNVLVSHVLTYYTVSLFIAIDPSFTNIMSFWFLFGLTTASRSNRCCVKLLRMRVYRHNFVRLVARSFQLFSSKMSIDWFTIFLYKDLSGKIPVH